MKKSKIPILLLTNDRPNLLEKVLKRIIKHTNWDEFDLWILDNFSTKANIKVINLFKANYPFINIYSTRYNQISKIQNEVIKLLKSDIYIKIDDDMFVTENWTKPLIDVYNRNHANMSFGSVIFPINGFGWVPFMEIMNYKDEFLKRFPNVELKQGCMDVAVFDNIAVNEFIWEKCVDIDNTAATFLANQSGKFQDLMCPYRYSIGTIVFSHKVWEDMGGWHVQDGYNKVLNKQRQYQKLATTIKKYFNKQNVNKQTRIDVLADVLAGATTCAVGGDEEGIWLYTKEKGLKVPVTTQGIAFHFSFGPLDQYTMDKFYLKIN